MMSFFGMLKSKNTAPALSFSEPIFIKDSSSIPDQIKKLQAIQKKAAGEQAQKIDEDIKMLYSGMAGEKTIAYELKSSYLPILILQDLSLTCGELTAQTDFVVIDQRFLLIIECKKLIDDIEINEKGDFIRCFKTPTGLIYKKEGFYNPITQNQRHLELIRKMLCSSIPELPLKDRPDFFQSVIVLANPKTVIRDKSAPEDVKNSIIKHDQLINYIKNLQSVKSSDRALSEIEMRKMADLLKSKNGVSSENYFKKYEIKPTVPICPKCNIPMVKRTAKKGENAGNDFYGCPNFPKCRHTLKINE